MKLKHTQSLEVADLVTNQKMTLADALHQVLSGIRDSTRPRTSEVADEAREIIASRQEGKPDGPASNNLFASWQELDEIAICAILDNNSETMDRYTAVFRDGNLLGFSESPTHPLGCSQWCGEKAALADIQEWLAKGETLIIDVPEWMQKHLLSRMNEAYRDSVDRELQKGRSIDEIRDEYFADCFNAPRFEASAGMAP